LLLWDGPQSDRLYAFFWSSYYLYPRRTVTSTLDSIDPNQFDTLVHAQLGTGADVRLGDFTPSQVIAYPDYTVTTYRHAGHG
jgi:hypothetical protein